MGKTLKKKKINKRQLKEDKRAIELLESIPPDVRVKMFDDGFEALTIEIEILKGRLEEMQELHQKLKKFLH